MVFVGVLHAAKDGQRGTIGLQSSKQPILRVIVRSENIKRRVGYHEPAVWFHVTLHGKDSGFLRHALEDGCVRFVQRRMGVREEVSAPQ